MVGAIAVMLVSVGINAADHYDSFSESILGRLLFGAPAGLCPEDMVAVSTENGFFCIDKYENSPGSDCPDRGVANQAETRDNLAAGDCAPVSAENVIPWRFISQSQAAVACAKAGKRLPTSEEWYLASLGTPDKSDNWQTDDCQVSSNWQTQPGKAGSGKNCFSAAGAFDMVGNVWEWTKGEVTDGYIDDTKLPDQGYIMSVNSQGVPLQTDSGRPDPNYNGDFLWVKNTDVRGIARGGYWDNKADAGIYSLYLVPPPDYAGTGIGFRCAK